MAGKFLNCIAEATEAMGEQAASLARETYDEALEALGPTLGGVEADREAGRRVMTALEAAALREARNRKLAVRARRQLLEGAAAYKGTRGYSKVKALGGSGGKPPKGGWRQGGEPPASGPWSRGGVFADYLKEVIDGSGGLSGSAVPSVKGRYQAVLGSLQAMMADLVDEMETKSGLPIRGKALLDNIVREAFGETTGDAAARALADAWGQTADFARKTFNAAGGDIPKLKGWGLPQSHDLLSVRRAGRDGWVEATLPRLAREKMTDAQTGLPFSERRLKAVLGEVWDSIVSSGAIRREAGEGLGQGMLANQRLDHRFLVFKGADDWLAYQGEFGRGDPYAAMMQHLDGMARDIARLQVLGPNPDHQMTWLANVARLEIAQEATRPGAPAEGLLNNADGRIKSAEEMYRLFKGEVSGPYGTENVIADVGAGVRASLSAVQLGSAVLNDVSNLVFAAKTRAMTGLSRTGDFKAWASWLTRPQTRAQARRTGLVLELTRARHASDVQRVLRAQTAGGKAAAGLNAVSRLLPTWMHQASFLDANMKASRYAFQLEFMGKIHDARDMTLAALLKSADGEDRALGETLRARGFTEADWAKVRASGDGEFVSPRMVAAAHGEDLGWRLAEMIERQTRFAVPEPSLWARSQLMMRSDPGTVQGELIRSAASYRSFSVTQTYAWSREFLVRATLAARAAEGQGAPWQARLAMMAAPMLLQATLSGVAIMWMKDIVKGNDPRPFWDDEDSEAGRKQAFRFLGAALAQGGGQGILGDFLFSVEARNGKSSAMTAFGPAAGFVSDTWDLTAGNVNEALAGEETRAGRETARYAGRYNPLASLWWSRTAFNRVVIDQLQRLIDPEAEADFQRQTRRMEREYGQTQWWPEGQLTPDHAPGMAPER